MDNLCHIPKGTSPMKKLTVILYILQKLVFIVQVLQLFLINDDDCVLE